MNLQAVLLIFAQIGVCTAILKNVTIFAEIRCAGTPVGAGKKVSFYDYDFISPDDHLGDALTDEKGQAFIVTTNDDGIGDLILEPYIMVEPNICPGKTPCRRFMDEKWRAKIFVDLPQSCAHNKRKEMEMIIDREEKNGKNVE